MSQQQAIQKLLAEKTISSASEKLEVLYAQNLLAISQKQSDTGSKQSLEKAQQLLQKPSQTSATKSAINKTTELLKQLNKHLNQSAIPQTNEHQNLSFSEQAQKPIEPKTNTQGYAELQSRRAFLSMQQRTFANQIVQQAIEQGPENPGPLNPQQLAINALKNMRDLSPAYLSRYVNYVDSLFALEYIGKQLAKDNKSKT